MSCGFRVSVAVELRGGVTRSFTVLRSGLVRSPVRSMNFTDHSRHVHRHRHRHSSVDSSIHRCSLARIGSLPDTTIVSSLYRSLRHVSQAFPWFMVSEASGLRRIPRVRQASGYSARVSLSDSGNWPLRYITLCDTNPKKVRNNIVVYCSSS